MVANVFRCVNGMRRPIVGVSWRLVRNEEALLVRMRVGGGWNARACRCSSSRSMGEGSRSVESGFSWWKFGLMRTLWIGCGVGLGVSASGLAMFVLDNPEPVAMMWEETESNEIAKGLFGKDLSRGILWDGAVHKHDASVTLPISGCLGKGSVFGRFLRREDGTWEPILMAVTKDGKQIQIFEKSGTLRGKAYSI